MTGEAGSLEVRAVGSIDGRLVVPSYQRGYRWTEHEVRTLLDDLHATQGRTYYLQPVVVRARADGAWDLVDGQQRLTTLLLLYRHIGREHVPGVAAGYTLSYATRPGSEAYLEEPTADLASENIDFFHLHAALRCIDAWFAALDTEPREVAAGLVDHLAGHVKVLWYVAPEDLEPRELFTRLNVGRIPLTDAELVKALLMRRPSPGSGTPDRSVEMALQWDAIERDLQSPEVWAFVAGAATDAPRIGLLLDSLARRPAPADDGGPFHTFLALQDRIERDPHGFWQDVVDRHSVVMGWYEDRELYHRVGLLVALGRRFGDVLDLADMRGRQAFEEALKAEVRTLLKLSDFELPDLGYDRDDAKIRTALLVMNVETVIAMTHSSERFSFRAYAEGRWSLEHIHAQRAEALTTAEAQEEWLLSHREALADLPHLADDERWELVTRIDEVLAEGVSGVTFRELEARVQKVFAAAGADEVHSIANLALLDVGANAALSNSVFAVKRRKVLELDRAGSYLPPCTRYVFLKYYGTSGAQQWYLWGPEDRDAYLEAMCGTLEPFLTKGCDER